MFKREKRHLYIFLAFIRTNIVLTIAFLAAVVTSFIVPPDRKYVGYIDFKTLTCLFCTLAVICALKNIRFFTIIAKKIVMLTGTVRRAVIAVVCITFIGSMLIANDMALLTFLPLGYVVIQTSGKKQYMIFTFIMQNIAANLGGMLTPFGNPQNLFLYNKFMIPNGEFIAIMSIPFAVAITLIIVCCFVFVKNEKTELHTEAEKPLPPVRTVLYLILFAFSVIIVFRLVPYWTGLIVIPASLLILDRNALKKVDYCLLFTFVCFFVFAGNMSRIDIVSDIFSMLLKKNTLVFSALSCQFISNVPSAILLSEFTADYRHLLLGVNIGGTGTLIASLASLITFRQYCAIEHHNTKKYLAVFSAFNFAFLAILLIVCSFI